MRVRIELRELFCPNGIDSCELIYPNPVPTFSEIPSTGNFTVARSAHTESILKIQDRSADCPSFEDVFKAKAASGQLLGSLLSNESAMPDTYTETDSEPAPVLTLTASWIKGGLILDCAAQHNILYMGGIDQFFQLLATVLQGKRLNDTTIEINTRDRGSICPLLTPEETRYDHSAIRCPSSSTPTQRKAPSSGSKCTFHYFRFSTESLSNLTKLSRTPSTDDALSAFIWERLSAIRHKEQSSDAVAGFSRAIDCRQTLDVSKEYMGVVVVKKSSQMTFQEMEAASLSDIAGQLRRDVRRVRDRQFLRSLGTLIAEEPDKSTSAATHKLDYGILGKPAFVRRPQSKPVQGLLYFLPMQDNGDIDVLLCLKDYEIYGLRDDVEWYKYAEYVG